MQKQTTPDKTVCLFNKRTGIVCMSQVSFSNPIASGPNSSPKTRQAIIESIFLILYHPPDTWVRITLVISMIMVLLDTNTAETRTTETKHQPPLYREFDQEQLGCVTISALCWIFHSTRSNVPSIDVVMPIESDGVADAHEVCARLGGALKTPNDKQDMQRVMDLVSAHIDKSDCSTGIWVPFEINQEDKWASTEKPD